MYIKHYRGQADSVVKYSVHGCKVTHLCLEPGSYSANTTCPDFELTVAPPSNRIICQVWPAVSYSYSVLIGWWWTQVTLTYIQNTYMYIVHTDDFTGLLATRNLCHILHTYIYIAFRYKYFTDSYVLIITLKIFP